MPRKTKEDRAAYMREYRARNSTPKVVLSRDEYRRKERERISKRRKETRRKINWLKKQLGCSLCGKTDPTDLDFHHTDPRNKFESISAMATKNRSWVLIVKEIKKCAVLCKPCHGEVHGRIMKDLTRVGDLPA